MNCVYFACPRCRSYIDAGYRWAYWALEEPGVVKETENVQVDRVFAASDYWNIDDSSQSAWLRDGVLPKVRKFLLEHHAHTILYVNEFWIYAKEESGEAWAEVETWCKNAEPDSGGNR